MATRTKVDFWRPDGGWGRAFVDDGTNKGFVFIHYSVVDPEPARGTDLTGRAIIVDGVDWKNPKGPKALAVYTAEKWEILEKIRHQAEEEKARKETEHQARLAQPHVEVTLVYKERARIALPEPTWYDSTTSQTDLVWGVGGKEEDEYGEGKFTATVKRFFPERALVPGDRFVLRHWGFDGRRHDEYWVYDHELKLVETLKADDVRRERWIAGRSFLEVGCGRKSDCRLAEEGKDPLWGVTAELDRRSDGEGHALDGTIVTFVPTPMKPGEKLIIRHWGWEGMRHDELLVYDHELKLAETLDAGTLVRESVRSGKPHFNLELGYKVQLEAADLDLAKIGARGTLVPVEKIDWVECAKAPVQKTKVEVTVTRPLAEGEFVALREWKGGGDGWDTIRYFDRDFQEAFSEDATTLRERAETRELAASGQLAEKLNQLRQDLEDAEARLKSLRKQAIGQPGFWARRNVDPVAEEVGSLQMEIYKLENNSK